MLCLRVTTSTVFPTSLGARSMILTDAMALLYRSHYAFSEAHRLRNAAGERTAAGSSTPPARACLFPAAPSV